MQGAPSFLRSDVVCCEFELITTKLVLQLFFPLCTLGFGNQQFLSGSEISHPVLSIVLINETYTCSML